MNDLQYAEFLDGYRSACFKDPLNQLARKGHAYALMDQSAVKEGPGGSKLLTMFPNADGGMPHTRPPNLICVPAYYNLTNETLLHERLHIHQRDHKSKWDGFFSQQGWVPVADGLIPDRWARRVRLNPDTLDSRFYAWENRFVPLPLFEREDRPDLRECVVRWWDQRSGGLLPDPPPSFVKVFGSNHPQPEHPREVNAVNLSRQFRLSSWDELESYLGKILV